MARTPRVLVAAALPPAHTAREAGQTERAKSQRACPLASLCHPFGAGCHTHRGQNEVSRPSFTRTPSQGSRPVSPGVHNCPSRVYNHCSWASAPLHPPEPREPLPASPLSHPGRLREHASSLLFHVTQGAEKPPNSGRGPRSVRLCGRLEMLTVLRAAKVIKKGWRLPVPCWLSPRRSEGLQPGPTGSQDEAARGRGTFLELPKG